MANQRALPPSLLLSFDSKLAARKAVFGLFFQTQSNKMCSRSNDSRFSLRVSFKRVFRLVLVDDEKNDGRYTADRDSGEEFNGSVD